MLNLFIGPSGSGKTEIANKLAAIYGYKIAKSYTTRPKRNEHENSYYFVSQDEFSTLSDKIAPVLYAGNNYCTTKEELLKSDIWIAEPSAIENLKQANIPFRIFYFDVPLRIRVERMKNRGDSIDKIKLRICLDRQVFDNFILLNPAAIVVDNIHAPEFVTGTIDSMIDSANRALELKKNNNSKKFRLLTDLDDVLENLCDVWLSLLTWLQRDNPVFVPKTADDLDCWNITKAFPMLTVDQVFEPLNTDVIWKQIRPLGGAVEALEKYNAMDDVDVRILTSSHYTSIAPKREFLRTYFPFINWNQVIITSEKKFVHGDVLVDDYEENLIDGNYKGILFYQPHNRYFDEKKHHGIIRAADWKGTEKIIDQMLLEWRKKQ